ncbi:hypothetical protein T03_3096 [Trichinella britovi]|uniref:Uncharacterized protein n=1 Tax=Trichinella britovi TaxID=45882 RepID=A0A0V1D431_TRIBR|nr:hypothetical protein T03_3096 [Trichinella britovi]
MILGLRPGKSTVLECDWGFVADEYHFLHQPQKFMNCSSR